jgi:hypothetical protein
VGGEGFCRAIGRKGRLVTVWKLVRLNCWLHTHQELNGVSKISESRVGVIAGAYPEA